MSNPKGDSSAKEAKEDHRDLTDADQHRKSLDSGTLTLKRFRLHLTLDVGRFTDRRQINCNTFGNIPFRDILAHC